MPSSSYLLISSQLFDSKIWLGDPQQKFNLATLYTLKVESADTKDRRSSVASFRSHFGSGRFGFNSDIYGMKTCARRGCKLEFHCGRVDNEYCCGPCRRNEGKHSQSCTARVNRASRNDGGYARRNDGAHENDTTSTARPSSALFVYDARIPRRYHYQQESVYHAICLCMASISRPIDERRKLLRRLKVSFHPDKTLDPNAHEITVMLNDFAEWYNEFAPM